METKKFRNPMAYVEGHYSRVEPYPRERLVTEEPDVVLTKSVVYRYTSDLVDTLLLYRGEVYEGDFDTRASIPGIYFKRLAHGRHRIIIVWPRTAEQKEEFNVAKGKDVVAAVIGHDFIADDFLDNDLKASDLGGDVYLPPIHAADDFMNKIVKLGIRMKNAPFEPYGRRMEAMAVDRQKAVERSNIRNNTKRRHRANSTMSPSKALQDAATWQLEMCVGIRNMPGAMHPMDIDDNDLLVIYPNGFPFDISEMNIIDVTDLVAKAISESSTGIESDEEATEEEEDN